MPSADDRHAPGTCVVCDDDRRRYPILGPSDPGPLHTEPQVGPGYGAAIRRLLAVVVIIGLAAAMAIAAWSCVVGI